MKVFSLFAIHFLTPAVSAFFVEPGLKARVNVLENHVRMNNYYGDSFCQDDLYSTVTTSLVSGTGTEIPGSASGAITTGRQQVSLASSEEPKQWELPAHHFYSSNDRRPTQEILDAELLIGRASICLAFVLFGTELGTEHSLPDLLLTSLASILSV